MLAECTRIGDARKLEKQIEDQFVKYAKSKKCLALKFAIPGRRYAPDRIIFCPGGHVFFIEFKRPKEKPKKGQSLFHEKLKALGFRTFICYSAEAAIDYLDREINGI